MKKNEVLIVVGPTASGKNDLALDIAERHDGVVVNADSMQIYGELEVITARPDAGELARAEHRLFAVARIDEPWSAQYYRDRVMEEIRDIQSRGKLPILTGGTGFYLSALLEGFSPIPEIPAAVREAEGVRYDRLGAEAFHSDLASYDEVAARRLHPNDRQRMVRAAEVYAHTGKNLTYWQGLPRKGRIDDLNFAALIFMPPREVLYDICDLRFDLMLEKGALEEVEAVAKMGYNRGLAGMKAVGVAEFLDYVDGKISLGESVELAKRETRRYAKRQLTWCKHQMAVEKEKYRYRVIESRYYEGLYEDILDFLGG